MPLLRTLLLTVLAVAASPAPAEPGLSENLTPVSGSPPAPVLALEAVDGARYDLTDLRGRVVLVNFWATWCPPCVAEMPAIERLYENLGPRGLEVLAVNTGEPQDAIEAFTARFEPSLTFPLLLDLDGQAFEHWSLRGLPKSYVVDKQGRLAYEAEGARDMDSTHIRGLLEGLLAP
jgi:thiol-disulfide isomerase/thioredoxin